MRASSIYFSAALAFLLQAGRVNGWAFRLERGVQDENEMLYQGWYGLKSYGGPKPCAAAGSDQGQPVSGFSITNFGPHDPGFREKESAPKEWRDLIGWMGFWKNIHCKGLPNIIVHFYPQPYTKQAIYFPKVLDFADEQLDIKDVRIGRYGDIPFGSVWFHGNRLVPEGAMAVRVAPARGGVVDVDEFQVFENAVKVTNVGEGNDERLLDPTDHRWDGSGEIEDEPYSVTLRLESPDINISTQPGDRNAQVALGLVPMNAGHGPYLPVPPSFRDLLLGGEDDDESDDDTENGDGGNGGDDDDDDGEDANGGTKIEEVGAKVEPGVKIEAEEQINVQQAAYRSLQDQGPRGPGLSNTASTQLESAVQNPGSMQLEPGLQNPGSMQADHEEEENIEPVGPVPSEAEKARSRLEVQAILSTLLERNPNWAQLTDRQRGEKYNAVVEERRQGNRRQFLQLIANTPNWNSLSDRERYELYQGLNLPGNRATSQENMQKWQEEFRIRNEQIRQGQEERRKREEERRRREEKAQRRSERRQKMIQDDEESNRQAVRLFIEEMEAKRRPNSQPNTDSNNPPPQSNAGRSMGTDYPPPRPNGGGGTGSNQGASRPPPSTNVNAGINSPSFESTFAPNIYNALQTNPNPGMNNPFQPANIMNYDNIPRPSMPNDPEVKREPVTGSRNTAPTYQNLYQRPDYRPEPFGPPVSNNIAFGGDPFSYGGLNNAPNSGISNNANARNMGRMEEERPDVFMKVGDSKWESDPIWGTLGFLGNQADDDIQVKEEEEEEFSAYKFRPPPQ
ncbi:hypothetical protein TWF281_002888 [Arthrobotrys megalospora]